MATFALPDIQDNANGWGPCQVPEKFKDMPYQPFSKSDRLGKVCLKFEKHLTNLTRSLTGPAPPTRIAST